MQLARVVGTLVATQKHRKFEGAKLLLVQPLTLDETAWVAVQHKNKFGKDYPPGSYKR